ncbi:P-loop containing nucleoside triphosphate hydrolase protein [Paraphysoderma sedebokerense]|nr:P-loop containing nucleoside triphosphate hydrolase protein [Paraphysoderma sedebokerense]
MALWVDKYRPSSLEKLDYHSDLSGHMKRLAQSGDFPHLLVYGPSGAGKKTRIMAILKELYGSGVEKLKIDQRQFSTPSGKKLEISTVSSNYHIEINPSDLGNQDRLVVQEIIKEVAQTQQVDVSATKKFKVVLISEADALSLPAQHALRRTMEKYMSNLRVILCATSTSKIISPVRSRCLLVRVAAPQNEEIAKVLLNVAKKEAFKLPEPLAIRIAEMSDRNLRRALLMLESVKVQAGATPLSETTDLTPFTPDWELFVAQVAKLILEEQSANRLLQVRGKLYELLTHCIPGSVVVKSLAFEIIKKVDNSIKPKILHAAAQYEYNLQRGQKPIFHLEAFVAKVMSVYKRYLMELCG